MDEIMLPSLKDGKHEVGWGGLFVGNWLLPASRITTVVILGS